MKCRIPNYNKVPISNNMMKRNIQRILESHQMSQECTNAVIRIYDFMIEKNYIGGCHALSSALYVALSELGLSPELCVGECQLPGTPPFDHSWITVNGEIIDLAVYFPLTQQINSISGPIILGIDAITARPPRTQYGIDTGLPLSPDTELVMRSSFVEYMDKFPMVKGGLWTLVMEALPQTLTTTADDLRTRYGGVVRRYVK